MASASLCDPCTGENLSVPATKYCPDCEERLCPICTESHTRFKAFKSHHVIDLLSVGLNFPTHAKKNCKLHPYMLLDYYCTDHDIICCRACIPKDHRKCENVLPLEHASKDVKKSALFTDVMADIKHLITTLNDLHDNRESNLQSLLKNKSVISNQISEVKSRLLKQIDDLERDVFAKLSSLQRKHENEINKQKEEISQVLVSLQTNENEFDFLKNHGSNNQLFIALYEKIKQIKNTESKVILMISNSLEIEIAFDEKKVRMIDHFEQLSETVNPCHIQYKSKKFQQAQIIAEPTTRFIRFEKESEVKLKFELKYDLKDAVVTSDNTLLLTDISSLNPRLYAYRNCKDYDTEITFSDAPYGVALISDTDIAVVTLPVQKSIQFINTTTMTKSNKVNVGLTCFGITAGSDRIYVGCANGIIKTLDTNGTILKTIQPRYDVIYFIAYNGSQEQLIVRYPNKLQCIKLDGRLVFSKDVFSEAGVVCDRQGNIYYGCYFNSKIQKMSPDGNNCEEMLNKVNGIKHPYGMCFNNDFTKLFVINNSLKSVYVYKLTNR